MPRPDSPPPGGAGEGGGPDRASTMGAKPLTPEQMRAVTLAHQRAGKLRTATRVALFNAICLGTIGAGALLFVAGEAAFGEFDTLGVIMGVGLAVLCRNELHGRTLLRQFSPRAPALLGWNQVALLGLIVAYAGWMIGVAMFGANPYEDVMRAEPQAARVLGNIGRLYRTLTVMVYGALIVGTLLFQGLTSYYYFTRSRLLRSYLAETPAWVVELQRRQVVGV